MNTKRIVISGITSSLGIHLASLLAAKGYQVRGFARRVEKAPVGLSAELISADLLDETALTAICEGASAVIHLAALSSPWGKYRDFYRVNVEGTRSLLRAAKCAGATRFVHVSTPSLYFDFRDQFDISESDPLPDKMVNAYAASKKVAESVVAEAHREHFECVILRPRAIFGPHDQALFPRLLKVCQKNGIPCFCKKSPIVDVTYVENAAHALCLALETSHTGEIYNITNGEPVALLELLERLLAKLDISYRKNKISYPLAYGAAWLAECASKLTGKEPVLTRYAVGVMAYSQTLSIEKARNKLQYTPLINLEEGIRRYVAWHQTT